jgi:hypothetical protein
MKKLLLLAIVVLAFTACKKEKLKLKDRLEDKLKKELVKDCPKLKKNFKDECKTKDGEKGWVNKDCNCVPYKRKD